VLAQEHHYYEILGVGYDATDDDLKRAYRKMAIKYHPDKTKLDADVAAEKFKQVAVAHKVLLDPAKREAYNEVITLLWQIVE